MTRYPLLCGFQELVMGNGFLSSVSAYGRALGVQEDDRGFWIYGVNPGAIAESGTTLREAHAKLLRSFHAYLIDVAKEALDFAAFKREVERFFGESDEESHREWLEAVALVRAKKVEIEDLPKDSADKPVWIRVIEIAKPSAKQNALEDDKPKLAA